MPVRLTGVARRHTREQVGAAFIARDLRERKRLEEATVRRDLDDVLSDSTISDPSVYREKPVRPQKYLKQVCRILGIEYAPAAAEVDARERVRGEVARLLETAEAAVLEEVLEHLRKQRSGGSPRDGGEREGGS